MYNGLSRPLNNSIPEKFDFFKQERRSINFSYKKTKKIETFDLRAVSYSSFM